MTTNEEIAHYIAAQPEPKCRDLQALHTRIAKTVLPKGRLWFFDGRNNENKIVSNPTIGYGFHTLKYADGKTRDFFQIGLSANSTGISVHIMGLKDKTYLREHFGKKIGKASVTGYCIKFKSLKDIDVDTLEAAMRYGVGVSAGS